MELFKTKRTLMRPFIEDDFNSLLEMMTNFNIMKFTGFRETQSPEKTKELLLKWITEGSDKLGVWASEEKVSGELIGWFMLKKTTSNDPEIGFMLREAKWGQGFATEVCIGLLEHAKRINCERVIAKVMSQNKNSVRVLQKLGMVEFKSKYKDVVTFEKILIL